MAADVAAAQCGDGAKAPRLYDWALKPLVAPTVTRAQAAAATQGKGGPCPFRLVGIQPLCHRRS
jgi:hypothetical protein